MQYFENNQDLISKKRKIKVLLNGQEYSFISDNGVFSKCEVDTGSIALLKVLLQQELDGNILDIGCGYGTIGLILAKNYPHCQFILSDVNVRACALARENRQIFNVNNVEIRDSNLFENISEEFDVIVTNPPIRAGKKIIYSIFEQSYQHLKQNGSLYLVIRKSHGAGSAQKYIHNIFGNCELLKKDKGFYIYCATKNEQNTKEDF